MTEKSSWYHLPKKYALFLIALSTIYIGFRWIQMFAEASPQDFHIYYYSILADAQGINEYSVEGLKEVSAGLTKFLFVYPPHTLALYQPFTWLSVENAARVFLLLKTLAFALLFVLWMKYLTRGDRKTHLAFLLLLTSVGYYECIYTDFKNGNVSVFEQAMLWTGILFFGRGKYWIYALFVFCASFFKLALIPFLGALLFVPKRKGWAPMVAGSLAFFTLHGLSFYFNPVEYRQFLGASTGLEETGPLNPSTMMFSRAAFAWLGKDIANVLYVLIATAIALLFLRTSWPRRDKTFDPFFLMVGYCFMYAIVMPRFKNYSFILLILPTYWMMQNYLPHKKWLFWALIAALVAHVAPYQTWAIAAYMLYLWFRQARRREVRA